MSSVYIIRIDHICLYEWNGLAGNQYEYVMLKETSVDGKYSKYLVISYCFFLMTRYWY